MIVIPSNGECFHLREHLERLRGLVADIEALSRGHHPAAGRLAAAPVLFDWTHATHAVPSLVGTFHGHPDIADGRAGRTSDLWVFAPEHGYARTLSRVYRLGARSGEARQ